MVTTEQLGGDSKGIKCEVATRITPKFHQIHVRCSDRFPPDLCVCFHWFCPAAYLLVTTPPVRNLPKQIRRVPISGRAAPQRTWVIRNRRYMAMGNWSTMLLQRSDGKHLVFLTSDCWKNTLISITEQKRSWRQVKLRGRSADGAGSRSNLRGSSLWVSPPPESSSPPAPAAQNVSPYVFAIFKVHSGVPYI